MAFPSPELVAPSFKPGPHTPVFFRTACVPDNSAYPAHTHAWGEFVYSFSGVMEVCVEGKTYLAPPRYGLWLPANQEHQGLSRYGSVHGSLYISGELMHSFPDQPCALHVSPLVCALLSHLREHPITPPYSDQQARMLRVLVDQLSSSAPLDTYLPTSQDPMLAPVLALLERQPGDNRPLDQLAALSHTTERTLMRRARRELGMSIADWKQRLRLVKAMPRLEAGEKVESVALGLGYSSASAFIAMFKRHIGVTPDEFRRRFKT
ncbi:AraC family transcriptional regulator [Marinobacterium lutimaris]|uniref:Transcriptional regulator, AraC family n=1 Tax=Marinobacterium lutimaris TaxID=568106 RepID=A0A1H5TFC0_9GAMM|nr:helix-turn-helix transcriptional regulator [Marinobacterium lutimaris]SEF61430.1 transcriptional regulator, AraC family [Marinobacterium lutimaris]